jgi:hypothetical protein
MTTADSRRLRVLTIRTGVQEGRVPSIVEVEKESPEIAAKMKALGYDALRPDLFRALARETTG